MFLDNILPAADLSDYVMKYTIVDTCFPPPHPVPYKAYPPHPQHCLQFFPRDMETISFPENGTIHKGKRHVVTGQHTRVTNRYIGREFLTLQVVFQPGALYRLSGIPADQLNNTYIDADMLFGNRLRSVNERLYHASDHGQMVNIIEEYLRQLIRARRKSAHPVEIIATSMMLLQMKVRILIGSAKKLA